VAQFLHAISIPSPHLLIEEVPLVTSA
jgi:hypothetical protein